MSATKGRHSHESVEHYSPQWMTAAARYVVSGSEDGPAFDLDPASSALANERIGARWIYTGPGSAQAAKVCAVDGLTQPWVAVTRPWVAVSGAGARVFCNPPTPAAKWWSKACHELAIGNVECCVFVAFSVELLQTAQSVAPFLPSAKGSMPSKLWHPLDFMCCFPKKRVAYDQRIEDRIAIVNKQIAKLPERQACDTKQVKKLHSLLLEKCTLLALHADGVKLVSGGSPPHSSAIVLMQKPGTVIDRNRARLRFAERFGQYGYIHEGRG